MANPGQPQFSPAREPGTASPLDLPEMEKLLVQVGGQDDKPLKPSKSLSGPLDLEQNGHSLPFKSRSSVQQGDLDGARRLGRLAGMLSITFIIMGIIIIIVAVTVNFAVPKK